MAKAKPKDEKGASILAAVDEERKRAATKALDISLNELADMYETGELDISPEFQRLFRWSLEKQSQLIESLVLEMPIPPIFVIESEGKEGKWELIDGLQRLSTYLHFRGVLDAPECSPAIGPGDHLVLARCDIVPELDGLKFDDLPLALQSRLKRSFLRVEVVRKETNPRFRYYMFKRLNTGGEKLEEQEVRNCTIRLLGTTFNVFIKELRSDEHFLTCIEPLTAEKRKRMIDVESVLRFFTFKNALASFRHDVGPFMTDFMERVTDQQAVNAIAFDYNKERAIFSKTFELLAKTLGSDTCKRWQGSHFVGGFSNHHFEAFGIGVSRVIDSVDPSDAGQLRKVRDALIGVKQAQDFQRLTQGGGQNSPGLYRKKIQMVEDAVRKLL
jgi:hypothetical protein